MQINSMPVGAHPITLSMTRLSRASQWILKQQRKFTPLLWLVTALPFTSLALTSLTANVSEAELELKIQENSVTDGPYVFLDDAQKNTGTDEIFVWVKQDKWCRFSYVLHKLRKWCSSSIWKYCHRN